MSKRGKAIVVGAGMGGLSAAAALAKNFDAVTVLDRDALPDGAAPRMGVGQGSHIHTLLKGGEEALEGLLPGFTQALYAAGGIPLQVGSEIEVTDFAGKLPLVDAGFAMTSMTRPAYEGVLRTSVSALPSVSIRSEAGVKRLLVANGRCTGVELEAGEKLTADLIVDASGMNGPLAQQLAEDGGAAFDSETIKINVAYTSGRFEMPAAYRGERRGFFFLPAPPSPYFGLLLPAEGDTWMVSLGGRGAITPPRDLAGFREYASRYDTHDIFERIRDARLLTELKTFRKTFVTRRRFDKSKAWPERLIAIGDAMSSVNPTYGQGMSVAALQAAELSRQLSARASDQTGLDGLSKDFLAPAMEIADRAWSLAINSDYVYPETEGERPPNFAMSRAAAATLRKLCDTDPEFLVFRMRFGHMLETGDRLRDGGPLAVKFFTALQGSMASS